MRHASSDPATAPRSSRRRRASTCALGLLAAVAIAAAPLLDSSGTAARPANAQARAATPAPAANSERWALIVGVTDYAGRTASTAAGAADAVDFREALLRNGFKPDHIVTLTDREATAGSIRNGLQWLVDRSAPERLLRLPLLRPRQADGWRPRPRRREDRRVPLAATTTSSSPTPSSPTYVGRLQGLAWIDIAGCEAAGLDDGISGPERVFTASSRETEKSYENPEWNNSIFTGIEIDQAFLQGMGDADGNGKVSIQEAFAFAAERAPQMTHGQKRGAQHPVGAGGDGREWYLDGPPAPPPPPASSAPAPAEDDCRQLLGCN